MNETRLSRRVQLVSNCLCTTGSICPCTHPTAIRFDPDRFWSHVLCESRKHKGKHVLTALRSFETLDGKRTSIEIRLVFNFEGIILSVNQNYLTTMVGPHIP